MNGELGLQDGEQDLIAPSMRNSMQPSVTALQDMVSLLGTIESGTTTMADASEGDPNALVSKAAAVKKDLAMTGEVTLRGNALPIGGLKEKLLAALRGGIKTVLIPEENEKDLADIPKNVKSSLEIIAVKNVSEVLKIALTEAPVPVEWDEAAEEAAAAKGLKKQNESQTTKH